MFILDKKGIQLIDQHDKNGFWGGKFGGSFVPETLKNHPRIINFKAPLINFSSTQIRNRIRENKEIRRLIPIKVYSYIRKRKIYL